MTATIANSSGDGEGGGCEEEAEEDDPFLCMTQREEVDLTRLDLKMDRSIL